MSAGHRSLKGLTPLMTDYMSVLVTLKPGKPLTLDEIRTKLGKARRYNRRDPAIKSLLNRGLIEVASDNEYTRFYPTLRGRLVFIHDRPYVAKQKQRQGVDT